MKKLFAVALSISLFLSCFAVALSYTADATAPAGAMAGSETEAPAYPHIADIVKAISDPATGIDGERAFDYLSYVFLGWRTTGGPWQNHVIENFIMDQLETAGYTNSGAEDKTTATDDDYAWLSYYDSSSRVWSPEYAKLEVTQAPAGNEGLISR
ncbi:MAG: hypothetical protein LBH39_07895, partial [Clostridiales Family XIII bacterium]|nr:hypothetical protein [Clostridiales Family XIII bacterium]